MTIAAALLAAAGVGFGHAILPDHWVPLAVVGRAERYPLAKIARLSSLAGIAHVLVSLILGGVIVVVGLQLRAAVQHVQDDIVGGILIATGTAFALLELRPGADRLRPGAHHLHPDAHHLRPGAHHHHHGEHHQRGGHHHQHDAAAAPRSLLTVMVPFGAAASPDLTILPVFLAATAAGAGAAISALVAFALVTVATIVGLTLFASAGGHLLQAQWLDRWGNLFTSVVLLAIGGLVLAGVL